MKPTHHAIVSGIAGVTISYFCNSWIVGISCLLSGVLIDLDHILDFFAEKKIFPFSYKELVYYCEYDRQGKLFLVFHGIEYVIILLIIFWKCPNGILLGIIVGEGLHLLCDQLSNPFRPLGYFILYRMGKKFERKEIFTKEYVHEKLQLS